MDLNWTTVSSKVAWRGRFPVLIDTIRADLDGREMEYTHLGMGRGAVVVLALDHRQNVICVRQYRHPMNGVTLELPAGHIDAGEDPLSAAARELEEETGLKARRLEPLGVYVPVPSLCAFTMRMFLASGLSQGRQALEPNELLEVVRMPITDLRAQILRGEHRAVSLTYTVLLADAHGRLPG